MATESKEEIVVDETKHGMGMIAGDNTGNYEWKITDNKMMRIILSAKNKQLFESPEFIMANLRWKLTLYPNGATESAIGSVNIYLKLVSFPGSLSSIGVSLGIFCKQTMTSYSYLIDYTKDGDSKGLPAGTLLLSEWKKSNLKNITIVTCIKVHHMKLKASSKFLAMLNMLNTSPSLNLIEQNYKNPIKFVDKIRNNKLINMMKKSWNKRKFESQPFDNMWILTYYPNGSAPEMKGKFGVFLQLCDLPPFIKTIKCKYNIKCQETNDQFGFDEELKFDKFGSGAHFMKFESIQSLQTLTFEVNIDIKEVIFVDTKDIYNVYDPQKIKQILALITQQPKPSNVSSDNNTITKIHQNIKALQKSAEAIQQNKTTLQPIKIQNNDDKAIINARLDCLSENSKKMDEKIQEISKQTKAAIDQMKQMYDARLNQIQNSMQQLTKQVNDMKSIISEEKKSDDNNDLKNQMQLLQQSVNILMTQSLSKKENKNVSEVSRWLKNVVKLPQYISLFNENGFDNLEIVKEIRMNDLIALGVDLMGHRIKIVKEIANLNKPAAQHEGGTAYI